MRNKLKNAISSLKGNAGASMVMVLITMTFITILGASLMYMSYTAMLLKSTERKGTINFYDAEELMDVIRAGFQEIASDAVGDAYAYVLSTYNYNTDVDLETRFHNNFTDFYLGTKHDEMEGFSSLTGTGYTINPAYLKQMLIDAGLTEEEIFLTNYGHNDTTNPNTANIQLTTSWTDKIEFDVNVGYIKFPKITISYKDPSTGYETTVSAHIVVNAPPFEITAPGYANYANPLYYTIITDGVLTNSNTLTFGGEAEITSVYAGDIVLEGDTTTVSTNTEIIVGGKDIETTPGDGSAPLTTERGKIEVLDDTTFNVEQGATIWAKNILLSGNRADLSLAGTSYIADDIEMNGEATSTEITNSAVYYGFGSSLTDHKNSSAILINGLNTDLSLPKVNNRVYLAGHSFVWQDDNSNTALMGESLSVKPNQTAYLLPPYSIAGPENLPIATNPLIVTDEALVAQYMSTDFTYDGGKQVKALASPISAGAVKQTLIYFFADFTTREEANDYYLDYYSDNKAQINAYIDDYVADYSVGEFLSTSGYYFYGSTESSFDINDTNYAPDSGQMQRMESLSSTYLNLIKTLSAAGGDDNATPFKYYTHEEKVEDYISGETGIIEFSDDTGVRALLCTQDDTTIDISGAYQDVNFILSLGSVTLTGGSFDGLVMAQEGLEVGAGVSTVISNNEGVNEALNSKNGEDIIGDFVTFVTTSPDLDAGDGANGPTWDFNIIVSYDEWTKS